MSKSEDVFVNPWPKERDLIIPSGATFLCCYEVSNIVMGYEEAAFFWRESGTDTLWVVSGWPGIVDNLDDGDLMQLLPVKTALLFGRAVSRASAGDETSAQLALLEILFRARVGHDWPGKLVVAGTFLSDYDQLVADLERELEVNTQSALGSETAVVHKARELGLHPDPTGKDPRLWNANCPGTNHRLLLNTDIDKFWCGYCNRNGDPAGLAEFVEDRRAKTA